MKCYLGNQSIQPTSKSSVFLGDTSVILVPEVLDSKANKWAEWMSVSAKFWAIIFTSVGKLLTSKWRNIRVLSSKRRWFCISKRVYTSDFLANLPMISLYAKYLWHNNFGTYKPNAHEKQFLLFWCDKSLDHRQNLSYNDFSFQHDQLIRFPQHWKDLISISDQGVGGILLTSISIWSVLIVEILSSSTSSLLISFGLPTTSFFASLFAKLLIWLSSDLNMLSKSK